MDNDTHRPQIEATLREGERRGVGQTPTFIFNGTVVPGAVPYDKYRQYVEEAAKIAPAPADSAAAPAPAGTSTAKPAP
jgi:predicted DsbA family dithiol-disulfide isomerase